MYWTFPISWLPVGVYVCDQDGLIVRSNRAAAELWGRSPEIGDPAVRFCGSYRLYGVNGAFIPHAKCPMAEVLATGQGLRDQEIIIERPGGTRLVALVSIEGIKDRFGCVARAVNVFRENPEQPAGRPYLNERGRDSDAILQSLPVAVYTTDAAGRITFYNEAAAQLWGCGRNSAKASSAVHGKCIGPTARRCRITSARWRWR
jgi:PAS domain-containing protein